jgi:outer membrane biogenesis lipoprotein LolB
MKLFLTILASLILLSCSSSGSSKKVVKPRYHHVWAKKSNRYRVDIPIGNRHIRFLERKRTKAVVMK